MTAERASQPRNESTAELVRSLSARSAQSYMCEPMTHMFNPACQKCTSLSTSTSTVSRARARARRAFVWFRTPGVCLVPRTPGVCLDKVPGKLTPRRDRVGRRR